MLFLFSIPVWHALGFYGILGSFYSLTIAGVEITDPLMALQTVLLSKQIYLPLLLSAVIPVLIALVFGKVFCSWACPYNTLVEWGYRLRRRFFSGNIKHHPVPERNPRALIFYGIFLFILLLILAFNIPLAGYLSPPGILSAQITSFLSQRIVSIELAAVFLLIVVEVAVGRRIWCKYLCPVGGMLAVFRTPFTLRIAYRSEQCGCKGNISPCQQSCPLGLQPKQPDAYPYCFNCGICLQACEKTGNCALAFSYKTKKE